MTLASSIASDRQRRIALFAQAALVLVAAAGLAFHSSPLTVPTLVPALIIAQLMTTYLLTAQSIQQRCPATALLAGAYIVTMVSYNIAPHLAFAGGATPEMYAFFGVVAHVGFAACFVAYAFLESHCNSRVFGPRPYRTRFAAIIALALFLPIASTAIYMLAGSTIAVPYNALSWVAVSVTAIAFVIYSLRVTPTVTNTWMQVALLADLADALLVAASPANSFGIFCAQVFGLITCAAMPTVYIIEFNWLYAKLAGMTSELQRQALLDQLTDVGNRRRFDDHMSRLCEAQARGKLHRFSVLLIDIDDFKAFNDTYGHPAGDACLKRIAKTIQRVLYRPGDEVARYGGEEFVVILTAAGAPDAALVAERIRRAVLDLAIVHAASAFGRITVSIGIASAPDHGTEPAILIERADSALYESKREGKNRTTRYLDTAAAPG